MHDIVENRKVALFGGSFNPPHIAHRMLCFSLLECKQFDKICFIPVYKHPFGKELVSFNHRLEMCKLLTKPFGKRIITTDVERYLVKRHGGKGYTIDMVTYFKTWYPEDDFTLIIGSDVSDELHKWRSIDAIKKLVDIQITPRMTHHRTRQDISATDIRKRIRQGESIVGLSPDSIITYIKNYGLYK